LQPAIANERLSILKDGSIAYRTSYPRGRRTHRVMLRMGFMARLAAIVPPPRFPLWRYHGVLAPGAPWRKHIVPAAAEPDDDGCSHKASTNSSEPAREDKRARKRTGDLDKPRKPSAVTSLLRPSSEPVAPSSSKPSWRPSTSHVPWALLLLLAVEVAADLGGPLVKDGLDKVALDACLGVGRELREGAAVGDERTGDGLPVGSSAAGDHVLGRRLGVAGDVLAAEAGAVSRRKGFHLANAVPSVHITRILRRSSRSTVVSDVQSVRAGYTLPVTTSSRT
jgi:hypothetical protein